MRRWKQTAGIILSLILAVSILPNMPVLAEDSPQSETQLEIQTDSQSETQTETQTDSQPEGQQSEDIQSKEPSGKEESKVPKIRLSVGNGQTTPQYQAGEQVQLTVSVTNEGASDAENVRIAPVIENAEEWPFEINSMNYELNLGEIKAGASAEANWELTVRGDVTTQAYKTRFHISYDDTITEYESDKYIYVKATAAETEKQEPEDQQEEQTPDDAELLAAAGGVYNSDPVAVGGGSGNTSVPRVIVTGFSTDPGTVNAGSNFRLVVHVKNTSSATAVSNMLFDLQAPSSGTEAAAEAPAFLPASGSSSIYLDSIPAGETRDIAIDLNARADLVQKPYSIAMTMKYEDSNAVQYEGASSVAIPVQQAARFEFSDIELSPDSIQVGEEANLTCSLYNTGRTKLYNVKVKFSGDGISAKDVFVGNVESGATGTIDGMLTGESEIPAGTKCKMVVSYEDESGNVSTTEQEFELEITPMVQEDMSMMAEPAEAEKGLPIIPIVLVVIVLVVIVIVVVIRRKKKKKALAEEEDLADEVDRFTEDE